MQVVGEKEQGNYIVAVNSTSCDSIMTLRATWVRHLMCIERLWGGDFLLASLWSR